MEGPRASFHKTPPSQKSSWMSKRVKTSAHGWELRKTLRDAAPELRIDAHDSPNFGAARPMLSIAGSAGGSLARNHAASRDEKTARAGAPNRCGDARNGDDQRGHHGRL